MTLDLILYTSMNFTPFTLEEAKEIWDDFEDLKDTEFKLGSPTVFLVDDVVISPFNEENKLEFINNYAQTKNSEASLSSYSGDEYDVLLVAYDVDDETNLTYIGIRTFAAEKSIKYSFPENAG